MDRGLPVCRHDFVEKPSANDRMKLVIQDVRGIESMVPFSASCVL